MRWIALILMLLSGTLLTTYAFKLNTFQLVSTPSLQFDFEKIDFEIRQFDKNMTLPTGGQQQIDQMRKTRAWMHLELLRRKNQGEYLVGAIGLLGMILFFLSFRRSGKESKKRKPSDLKEGSSWEINVPEAQPREEYVDEYEFGRRGEGGFRSRDEAVEWLMKDPLLKCDYCGAKLRPTFGSEREALELVTFYKKVPPGAKDLRIVLGSMWFTKPAAELRCTGCDRLVKR